MLLLLGLKEQVIKENKVSNIRLSKKYAGKLPADIADDMQNYVNQSRNEWND